MTTARRLLTAALATTGLLVLTACGSGSAADTGAGPAPSTGTGFPVTVKHSEGETTIEKEPTRIVTLGFEEDALAVVGVRTVGHLGYHRDGGFPWEKGTVDLTGSTDLDVGSGLASELNLERLAALRPDLILATGYWQIAEQYDRLSQIAPTVAPITGVSKDSWEDNARIAAKAVGRSAPMESEIARTQQVVDQLVEDLPGLKGKTYAGAYHHGPAALTVNIDEQGNTAQLMTRLGLVQNPALIKQLSGKGGTRLPLSMEQLGLLDADLLMLGHASDDLKKQLDQEPQYTRLKVVQDGHVVESDWSGSVAGNNPNVLNVRWRMDALLRPVLEKVAAG